MVVWPRDYGTFPHGPAASRGAGDIPALKAENIRKEHFIVLLASTVPDTHLAELAADGVSYIVSAAPQIDLAVALDVLNREFGIRRLLLEGGGVIVGSMLKAGLCDEFSLVLYPAVDGHSGERTIVEAGESGVGREVRLSLQSVARLEADVVWMRYGVANSGKG
jgi:riboflavin biosynthesis pyrimidine reductase